MLNCNCTTSESICTGIDCKNRIQGSYWSLEADVSNGFNRLKAKIYNSLEASVANEKQLKALKGLIKGFANDEFRLLLENMRYTAKRAQLLKDDMNSNIPPIGAEPLEFGELEEPIR